ncbi:hypothetical protein LEMLEM_LOCUS11274 [Lemmus lemmus]
MGEEENRRVYQGPAADDSRRNELQDHLIFTEGTVENSGLHSRLLTEQTQLNKKVDMLRQEKKNLLDNWALLKDHLEDMNVICKDQEEETGDLNIQ